MTLRRTFTPLEVLTQAAQDYALSLGQAQSKEHDSRVLELKKELAASRAANAKLREQIQALREAHQGEIERARQGLHSAAALDIAMSEEAPNHA